MGKRIYFKILWLTVLLAVATAVGPNRLYAQAAEEGAPPSKPVKITVGAVEEVILNPWGVSFPARIDTGADFSSLDARDIEVRNNIANFKLGKRYGGLQLHLPVVDWRTSKRQWARRKGPSLKFRFAWVQSFFVRRRL